MGAPHIFLTKLGRKQLRFTTLARGLCEMDIYFSGVRLDALHDLFRQDKRLATLFPTDKRWSARADGVQKRLKFGPKGIGWKGF